MSCFLFRFFESQSKNWHSSKKTKAKKQVFHIKKSRGLLFRWLIYLGHLPHFSHPTICAAANDMGFFLINTVATSYLDTANILLWLWLVVSHVVTFAIFNTPKRVAPEAYTVINSNSNKIKHGKTREPNDHDHTFQAEKTASDQVTFDPVHQLQLLTTKSTMRSRGFFDTKKKEVSIRNLVLSCRVGSLWCFFHKKKWSHTYSSSTLVRLQQKII